jgi:16S rRNA G966 N2-methylase RsmD
MLKKHQQSSENAEAAWDMRAKSFGKALKKGGMDNSKEIVQALLNKGLLKEQEVLDVGGGTGRYAIPFAAHAKEVIMVDISTQMLEIARRNAENEGHSNLKYIKLSWEDADLKELGWEKRFDLVFSSMSPAYRSKEGIEKMTLASKGWCQINQLIEMTDDITQKLSQDLMVEKRYDPHNDRDAVQGIYNLLWVHGFEPEITYLKEVSQQVLSIEDAVQQYSRRFGKMAELKGADLKRLLKDYAGGDTISIDSRTTLAKILWKA